MGGNPEQDQAKRPGTKPTKPKTKDKTRDRNRNPTHRHPNERNTKSSAVTVLMKGVESVFVACQKQRREALFASPCRIANPDKSPWKTICNLLGVSSCREFVQDQTQVLAQLERNCCQVQVEAEGEKDRHLDWATTELGNTMSKFEAEPQFR